jgi:hypothetical protein
MGIYQDIQDDMKEAMDDDLADAVAILTITENASSTSYDPVGGLPSSTPVVNSMRCIIVDADLRDEQSPESDTSISMIEVMILDSERTTVFRTGVSANVRGSDYEVMQYKVDPAGATHNLELRRR